MLFLSRNNVRELIFTNSNRRYELPYHVFSCSDLRKLTLGNCIFMPPLKFEGFLNLENLRLTNIDFRANSCGALVNLPRLRWLSLVKCRNVFNFNIKARNLCVLLVTACVDAMLLRLMDSPCLNVVYIYFWEPIEDCVQLEGMNLIKMLSILPELQLLCIDGHFLKVPKWLPVAINSLKYLRLLNCQLSDLDQLHGALCLLRNSPNLERLCMMDKNVKPQVMDYDVGPALDHLESLHCLDHTLNQLQTLEIRNIEGSRLQLLFIKLLLAHSPSLDKLIIRSSGTSDAHQRRDVAKDIMLFPRASPKAEMIYLNPEP
ncbi:hypothetical protein L6452_30102 [Arctium lappa]|uniref:Uncharacterized protein n=1 Tax=Arctium lappa TaxID=4217 RepID=A0ACB8ZHV0_ARCLA|nr:hypothetical protein L6452_30102 [Arctium lappa]